MFSVCKQLLAEYRATLMIDTSLNLIGPVASPMARATS